MVTETKKLRIFLDDERVPPAGGFGFIISNEDYERKLGNMKYLLDYVICDISDFNHLYEIYSKYPEPDKDIWVICRDVETAKIVIEKFGVEYVSFDNDLQKTLEGVDLAKWLIEKDLDDNSFLNDFSFFVHSQNSIAKIAINDKLNDYLDYKKRNNLSI